MSNKETNPQLDFERISVLYENTNVGYFGIAAGVPFFGYMIDQLASIQAAYPWMIAVGISYIPRLILSTFFARKMKVREITVENEHQSLTDPLTKLGNRRRLYLLIEKADQCLYVAKTEGKDRFVLAES